ncbi:cytochrome o ubiquinol oxidase operon protein cyoD [Palleronia aestuarii]|uniref:Cytochrome bo(3) ubiquinol oxidase subunit 4 n=1 Tax=Palleronia aestuarii TaxID=568105 RepID=A0A2W7N310_9RHOB|nr:cytochrome o ubiquinol oxidase subunit IV [Palleronia aestuarii]PZX14451.1 cytochrome o ubiquinol oxidase operon protein cyoD [Palleronia aestuarii]
MSPAHLDGLDETEAPDHDGHHDHGSGAHGSLRGYLTGFVLAAILTAIPFWLVMDRPLDSAQATAFIVVGFAVVQIVVHMIFFLHMDPRSEGGWTFMALIFTFIILVIAVSGTLWVMYHMNTNMMPTHEMDAL